MKVDLERRRQFRKGLRVRLNEVGMAQTNVLRNRSGVVVGYARDGRAARVLWDDHLAPQNWDFASLIPDPR